MKDYLERYEAAIKDLEQFRASWDKLGRPEMCKGSQLQDVQHPLVKMIRDAERACTVLGQAAGVVPTPRRGRPPGTGSAPDRSKRPQLVAVS